MEEVKKEGRSVERKEEWQMSGRAERWVDVLSEWDEEEEGEDCGEREEAGDAVLVKAGCRMIGCGCVAD